MFHQTLSHSMTSCSCKHSRSAIRFADTNLSLKGKQNQISNCSEHWALLLALRQMLFLSTMNVPSGHGLVPCKAESPKPIKNASTSTFTANNHYGPTWESASALTTPEIDFLAFFLNSTSHTTENVIELMARNDVECLPGPRCVGLKTNTWQIAARINKIDGEENEFWLTQWWSWAKSKQTRRFCRLDIGLEFGQHVMKFNSTLVFCNLHTKERRWNVATRKVINSAQSVVTKAGNIKIMWSCVHCEQP